MRCAKGLRFRCLKKTQAYPDGTSRLSESWDLASKAKPWPAGCRRPQSGRRGHRGPRTWCRSPLRIAHLRKNKQRRHSYRQRPEKGTVIFSVRAKPDTIQSDRNISGLDRWMPVDLPAGYARLGSPRRGRDSNLFTNGDSYRQVGRPPYDVGDDEVEQPDGGETRRHDG